VNQKGPGDSPGPSYVVAQAYRPAMWAQTVRPVDTERGALPMSGRAKSRVRSCKVADVWCKNRRVRPCKVTPMPALNSLVSESVDVVVHCARDKDGPRVTEIIAVEDQAAGYDATQFTVTDLFRRPRHDRPLEWTGLLPGRAARALEEAGYDLRQLLGVPDQSRQIRVDGGVVADLRSEAELSR
jgi:hypothetical protein